MGRGAGFEETLELPTVMAPPSVGFQAGVQLLDEEGSLLRLSYLTPGKSSTLRSGTLLYLTDLEQPQVASVPDARDEPEQSCVGLFVTTGECVVCGYSRACSHSALYRAAERSGALEALRARAEADPPSYRAAPGVYAMVEGARQHARFAVVSSAEGLYYSLNRGGELDPLQGTIAPRPAGDIVVCTRCGYRGCGFLNLARRLCHGLELSEFPYPNSYAPTRKGELAKLKHRRYRHPYVVPREAPRYVSEWTPTPTGGQFSISVNDLPVLTYDHLRATSVACTLCGDADYCGHDPALRQPPCPLCGPREECGHDALLAATAQLP